MTAARESLRPGDANESAPNMMMLQLSVAVEAARPIQRRCMSSNRRPSRALRVPSCSA
jgi:hypothetical protein